MFKDRLRAARYARGFTAQNMADVLNTGLRNYQKYESGDARPTYEGIIIICDYLNIPSDYLFGRDEFLKSMGVSVDVPKEGPPKRVSSHQNSKDRKKEVK